MLVTVKQMKKIVLVIILLFQLIVRVYFGNEKTYFHMDESYSYGLMNYDKINITDNEAFLNNWHDQNYYIDYYAVNDNEITNFIPIYENQKNDVHPPLYYLLLRVIASFNINSFTKWSGLILNNLIFIISSIFIYIISKKLFKNEIYALLTVFVSGFVLATIEMSLFIRMYELLSLWILILINEILKIKEKLTIKNLIFLNIILLLGGLTQYHFFIFAVGIVIYLLYFLIKDKRYSDLKKLIIGIIITAGIYIIIFPFAINHIFFSYRGINANKPDIFNIFKYLYIVATKIAPFSVIVMSIYFFRRKKYEDKNINILVIPVILYFLVIALTTPWQDLRYIMAISPVIIIIIIYILKDYKKLLPLVIFLIIIPKVHLDMTYSDKKEIVARLENNDLPLIYVFNNDNNRFLDDIYLFTKASKSLIVKNYDLSKIEIIEDKGCYIIIAEGAEETIEELKTKTGFDNYEMIKELNAAKIYYYN